MHKAYLTIDDTPSAQTDELTAFLTARGVPALLFCRGDRLENNPEPAVRAVQAGFVLGNHAYSHTRFSTLSLADGIAEIGKTESLIDDVYSRARVTRPGRYFRFPHMDRGCGGWIVDYDAAPAHRQTLIDLFGGGLNIDLTPPDDKAREKKYALQGWLKAQGFRAPPFHGVAHDWFADTEVGAAVDAMFTYSTSDWMVTPRHAGKWQYKTLDDLCRKIDDDPFLWQEDSTHIILAHDQDGLFGTVSALIDHFLSRGFIFADIKE